jgi:hypothetical protein
MAPIRSSPGSVRHRQPARARRAVDRSLLPDVADAPAKQGRRMPATGILVIAPAELAAARPDAVVLFMSDLIPEMRVMPPEVEAAGARWVDVEALGPRPTCKRRSFQRSLSSSSAPLQPAR